MKTMQTPEIEIIKIDQTDIVTASGPMENGGSESTPGYGGVSGFGDLIL